MRRRDFRAPQGRPVVTFSAYTSYVKREDPQNLARFDRHGRRSRQAVPGRIAIMPHRFEEIRSDRLHSFSRKANACPGQSRRNLPPRRNDNEQRMNQSESV